MKYRGKIGGLYVYRAAFSTDLPGTDSDVVMRNEIAGRNSSDEVADAILRRYDVESILVRGDHDSLIGGVCSYGILDPLL